MYVIAKELIGAPGMPATTKGIRQALQRYVQGKSCCSRRRSGSKATEYSIDCLPEVTQQALRERYALQLMTQKADESPAPVVTKARRSPAVVDAVEAYRGSPQLMVERLNALTENQRKVAEARIAIVSEVLKIAQQPGFSCAKAIRFLVNSLARSQLDERIVAMVETANAKKGNSRALSEITLKRWIAAFNKAQNAAERLLLLAPGKRQEIKAEDINWLPEFLAQYRQSNGRPMTEAYEDFVAEWQHRHADEPYMLDIMPSYDTIRRAMKKLPEVVKQKGRVSVSSGEDHLSTRNVEAGVDKQTGEVREMPVTTYSDGTRTMTPDVGWSYNPGSAAFGTDQALIRKLIEVKSPALREMVVQEMNNSPERQLAFRIWAKNIMQTRRGGNDIRTLGFMTESIAQAVESRTGTPPARLLAMSGKNVLHADSVKHQNDGIALTPEDFGRLPAMLAKPKAVLWDKRHNNLMYIVENQDGSVQIAVNAPYSLKRQPDKLDVIVNAYRVINMDKLKSDIRGGMLEVLEGQID
ncbi:hypothetical protein GAR01_12570 [Escherichia coli]|nr:hypothetical protein [Escherichia coli]